MNNNSYKFRDILFGLRYEYLKLEEQLNSLKSYILMDENNLSDVYFHLVQNYSDNTVRMLCTIYERMNYIESILEKIKIELGFCPDYRVSYVKEMDGKYNIESYPEILNNSKINEFSQSVFYIFNTDFGKNIKFIHNGVGYGNKPFLSVNTNSIYLYHHKYVSLEYNPHKGDFIHINSLKGKLTYDKIDNIFNMEFSRNVFPKYYQDVIESSSLIGKELEFDFDYTKKGDFDIVEDTKKVVLVKRRVR